MTERDYTQDELAILAKYEDNIRRAVYSDWCKAMSRSEVEDIYKAHVAATEWNTRLHHGCSACLYTLLNAVGRKYYDQINRQDAKGQNPADDQPKTAVKVKTRREKK